MRSQTVTRKVKTPYGSMYVSIEIDEAGRLKGGNIFAPLRKTEGSSLGLEARIAVLVEKLSEGFDDALKGAEVLTARAQKRRK